MEIEKENEKIEKKTTVKAALAIGFVCIVVGLPLWWKTTTVYRVQLPYSEITQLSNIKLKVTADIYIILTEQNEDAKVSRIFEDKLRQSLEGKRLIEDAIWVDYVLHFKQISGEQKQAMSHAKNSHEMDHIFEGPQNRYSYNVVLLSKDLLFNPSKPFVGRKKAAYIPHMSNIEQTIPSIITIAKTVLVNEKALVRAVETATGAKHQQSDKESMRKVHSHSGYQFTFTLLNPQPDIIDIRWNVPQAIRDFLTPLTSKFEKLIELKTKSQYLHYLGIGASPKKDSKTGESYLTQTDLPHIINPIEGYLASHVSTDPDLNFVVYVPSRNQSPMKIVDSSGQATLTNSFLIPRWGGFLVYNVDLPANSSLPANVEVDMRKVMEIAIGQIRLLLGVTTQDLHPDVEVLQPGNDVITQWEMDFWLRSHCVENIAYSVLTLSSLANLLEKINNMVINDHVGLQVEKAVSFVHKSIRLLTEGNLREAFVASRNALTASESAFFDQSLLELLYFPEDQKFAIYIPLFLPIGIPIVMSVLQAVKYLTKKPDKTKKE